MGNYKSKDRERDKERFSGENSLNNKRIKKVNSFWVECLGSISDFVFDHRALPPSLSLPLSVCMLCSTVLYISLLLRFLSAKQWKESFLCFLQSPAITHMHSL